MPHRQLVNWVGNRANVIITGLLFLSLGLAILAASGYNKARDAQERVNAIELERAQEAVGKRVADVATCFTRARGRPQLTRVLRGISGQLGDLEARAAANALVESYERETPTRADCVALANKLDVDWKPYVENPEPKGIGQAPQP